MSAILEFHRISKRFGVVPVLKSVSLALGDGRTLGLVGENGAGKSTLVAILGGELRADSGRMVFEGREYAPQGPADAARAGIAFVHQEPNLFANLSVAENLFLTRLPRIGRLPVFSRRRLHEDARRVLREVRLEIPPQTPVEKLSPGERQLVEIARALGARPKLLILDEPTTSLSARETETLFGLLSSLRDRRVAMLYISHALRDVLRLADDIAVLRDGELVASGAAKDFDRDRLVSCMVGRPIGPLYPARAETVPGARARGPASLEVEKLSSKGVARDVTFRVHRGEILGIFGLMGAGRSELARLLFGLDPSDRGAVRLEGKPLEGLSPSQRIRHGLAFVTEDRRYDGLALEASIADNLSLVTLRQHAGRAIGLLRQDAIREAVRGIRSVVRITPAAADGAPVRTLSGGNQQKTVLGKWLLARPRALILDEPTRGIDVGARFEIYRLIADLAASGTGIVLISSELEELLGLSDRILVLRRGEVVAEFARPEFDSERILGAALEGEASP